jgi:hypothetical protein
MAANLNRPISTIRYAPTSVGVSAGSIPSHGTVPVSITGNPILRPVSGGPVAASPVTFTPSPAPISFRPPVTKAPKSGGPIFAYQPNFVNPSTI